MRGHGQLLSSVVTFDWRLSRQNFLLCWYIGDRTNFNLSIAAYSRPAHAESKVNFATSRADCILYNGTLNSVTVWWWVHWNFETIRCFSRRWKVRKGIDVLESFNIFWKSWNSWRSWESWKSWKFYFKESWELLETSIQQTSSMLRSK